jgi:curved DNA-binding protein CbpA
MAATDLYALLKVDKAALPAQLKKAYYALARIVHPDKRPGDAQAEADFLALKAAYDILSDPVRRRRYDRTGSVDDDADFAAAYEAYRGIPVSEEDILATEAEYRHSDDERMDVIEYARRRAGDVARILEAIIGSRDEDAARYRAILEDALSKGDLPKKLRKPIAKAIFSFAELEADAEELSSSEEEEEEEENEEGGLDDDADEDMDGGDAEEEDDDDNVDLAPPAEVATARAAAASDEGSSDLLAMFASRRAERQQGFDAFAAKWVRISEAEAAAPKKKRASKAPAKKRSSSKKK